VKPLVIFGAGEIAEVAHFYLTHDARREVAGFTVDDDYVKGDTFLGRPVAPFSLVAERFSPSEHDLFVALSYSQLNKLRAARCAEAKAKGYRLASYVSSKATAWPGLVTGDNCFILEDNTIQPFASIGDNVTLWSGNHIGHHAQIKENCFISSHVVISGGVIVKRNSFLGVNATIRDHVTIGEYSVIGAGALVTADVPDCGVVAQAAGQLSKVPSTRLRKI